MTQATIRANIQTVLEATAPLMQVFDYTRWLTDWVEFQEKFSDVNGNINVAFIRWAGFPSNNELAKFGIPLSVFRPHVFTIMGFYANNDEKATEKTFAVIAEAIADAFDASTTFHNGQTYYETSPASLDYGYRRVPDAAGVLCNFFEITITVTEQT